MSSVFSWRSYYLVLLALRFYFALANSYIHPDEHFQSMEVICNKILHYSGNLPWEFTSGNQARSMGPLYLMYGPILYSIKWLGLQLTPLQIWYVVRLQNVFLTWIITDMCIYRLLPTKPERIKGVYFTLSSYVTLVYQSHLFSNSIETCLLLLAIVIINNLRFAQEIKTKSDENSPNSSLLWLGVIVSIGVFNRVTFPAFLVLPFWYVLTYVWCHKVSGIYLAIGAIVPTYLFILIDSLSFGKSWAQIIASPFDLDSYVITPLNNLIYNTNYSNLAQHGIHPYYTHILVNLPQLLGPGILFLFKTSYWKTTPFLSIVSGIVVLSLVPHQELRFLIPIVPLACCCFDLYSYSTNYEGKLRQSLLGSISLKSWYIFNIAMAMLMGVFHQGGVVPALDELHLQLFQNTSTSSVQVWWRTYSPPTWMLGDTNSTVQTITLNDENFHLGYELDTSKQNYVFDMMGTNYDKVYQFLVGLKKQRDRPVYFITPTASFNVNFENQALKFNSTWNYTFHLDMDHLDFSDYETLVPGLSIYEML
ncbi:hypothetical protein G9P44_000087 [Scheffersomyces stipitis]|nr:hypothetical protein G9P44_000087 [Scheffersomyces stipitis]